LAGAGEGGGCGVIDQIAIACTGVTAIFLSQCKAEKARKYSSVFGLVSQPFWFYATIQAEQWGIVVLCFFYTLAWLKGFWMYWVKPYFDSEEFEGW
jgi:hypothetical protein